MQPATLRDQIMDEVDKLSADQQAHLLDVARRLRQTPLPPGTPGETLLAHQHEFDFAPGDLEEMMRAIEECCGRIDWDGWQ
jgi:hypothetical protein